MSQRAIDRELARLSGLRYVPADMAGHREVLASVQPLLLTAAVGKALRECRDFPTPSELLGYVDQARTWAASSRPTSHGDEPECAVCADSGWQSMWCGRRDSLPFVLADRGVLPNQCGRRFEHATHEFAVECACRPTNRTYLRKREQECASARKRTESRQGA